MRKAIFMLFVLIVIGSASAFLCGNTICENSRTWYGREDISNCYEDCWDKEFVLCNVSKTNGSYCRFGGKDAFINFENANGYAICGVNQRIKINISWGLEKIVYWPNVPNSWIPFDVLNRSFYLKYDIVSCLENITEYTFYITGPCLVDECKFIPRLSLSHMNVYLKEQTYLIPNLSLPEDLESAMFSNDIIAPNGTRFLYSAGFGLETVNSASIDISSEFSDTAIHRYFPGVYTYFVGIWDENELNFLGNATARFNVHECRNSNNCNDKNPCTVDTCSGNPQLCSSARGPGCVSGILCVPRQGRTDTHYCTAMDELIGLKSDKSSCTNDYECETNRCRKNLCHRTIWMKIRDFFASILSRT